MRKNTRTKVTRLLISSLMSSSLTPNELMEVCESFMGKDELMRELGHHLHYLVTNTMYIDSHETDVDEAFEYAHGLIKSRRLSKEMIIDIVDDMLPALADYLKSQRLTLRSMLEIIKTHTDPTFWDHFLIRIDSDDYLEHIIRRIK